MHAEHNNVVWYERNFQQILGRSVKLGDQYFFLVHAAAFRQRKPRFMSLSPVKHKNREIYAESLRSMRKAWLMWRFMRKAWLDVCFSQPRTCYPGLAAKAMFCEIIVLPAVYTFKSADYEFWPWFL
jgi:hypothetical protein